MKTITTPPTGTKTTPQGEGASAPPDSPLQALAAQVEGKAQEEADKAAQEAQGAGAAPEPGLPPEFAAAIARIPLFFLKAVRAKVAKRMPEIMEHWTDDVLSAPANAVPPILEKHAARLSPIVGAFPEESILVLSCLPLVLGYFAASDAASSKEEKTVNVAAVVVADNPQAPQAEPVAPGGQVVQAQAAEPPGFVPSRNMGPA